MNQKFEKVINQYTKNNLSYCDLRNWIYCSLFILKTNENVFYRDVLIEFEQSEKRFILFDASNVSKESRGNPSISVNNYTKNFYGADSLTVLEDLCVLDAQDKYFIVCEIVLDIDLIITDTRTGSFLSTAKS